jgi:DNA gyrase/topoisomerase IV subunit B
MNIYTSKEKIESYKNAVENNAGGKFYTGKLDEMSSSIVNEIKETKTSLQNTSKKIYVTDHPEAIFIIIVVIFFIVVVFEKIMKI